MSRADYETQTWHDLPVEDTPISAERLGHMEAGIALVNNRALKEVYNDEYITLGTRGQEPEDVAPDSVSIGSGNVNSESYTLAVGYGLITDSNGEILCGSYNEPKSLAALVVGNGLGDESRSNALTLKTTGDAEFAGEIEAVNIPAPPTTMGNYVLTCHVWGSGKSGRAFEWASTS